MYAAIVYKLKIEEDWIYLDLGTFTEDGFRETNKYLVNKIFAVQIKVTGNAERNKNSKLETQTFSE